MIVEKNGKIRVLVVDDSAFMRVALRKMMEEDSTIEVAGVARNGEEALYKIQDLKPDIVTMDIEMPVMDGLTALQRIMKEKPLPVIMISALTEEGADATFKALELGAIDFIPKGGKSYVNLDIVKVAEQLRQKIRAIVRKHRWERLKGGSLFSLRENLSEEQRGPQKPKDRTCKKKCRIVALGVSTGGPLALHHMLPKIPADFQSSMLIVQHMPPTFTGPFARRLDAISLISVKEAAEGDVLEPGCAYMAPGGIHMKVKEEKPGRLRILLNSEPQELLFVPSVDVMMESVAENYYGRTLGVIMTGMGSDGLKGMTRIKEKGGTTLAQEESSCVVYGMPKVCVDKGIIDQIVLLDDLADEIAFYAG